MRLTILYRGPLASCNYGCRYCPFGKRRASRSEGADDARALSRFVAWIETRSTDALRVFFTPWGEALVRRRYQDALARLSRLNQIESVGIQTNLSCGLAWLEKCDLSRLSLWVSYHPTEIARERFVAKCHELVRRGVRFSVGVVGRREHFDAIEALRTELPPAVYLWVNAYKVAPRYYAERDLERLETIDPLFRINATDHPSAGRACRTGLSAITVDGDGTVRRCHFVEHTLGNLYEQALEQVLVERPCPKPVCRCHLGYVHLAEPALERMFGASALERVPEIGEGRDARAELTARASCLIPAAGLLRAAISSTFSSACNSAGAQHQSSGDSKG